MDTAAGKKGQNYLSGKLYTHSSAVLQRPGE